MRFMDIKNQDGKALVAILWAFGIVIIIILLGVLLTVTGAYKYPQSAINYPIIGQFIAKYGTFQEPESEEPEFDQQKLLEQTSDEMSNQNAVYLRDISLKAQQIEDLKGELEAKNDQIAKLEETLQSYKTQLETYKQKNLKALINVYDRMETRAAAEILSQMNPERAAIILSNIKDKKAAEILAAMDRQTALTLTQIMGGFDRSSPEQIQPIINPRNVPATPSGLREPVNPAMPKQETAESASGIGTNPQLVGPLPPEDEEENKKEKEEEKKSQ